MVRVRYRAKRVRKKNCLAETSIPNYISTVNTFTSTQSELNLLINENFTLYCNLNIFSIEKLVKNTSQSGWMITYFDQIKPFSEMKFTSDSSRISEAPNAGGSSIESETLSFEILKKFFNAKLLKTEMEVPYWPEGGSMNDYVVYLFNSVIGVSVTRAMNYKGDVFSVDDANKLLKKKLKGICQSSKNSMIKWDKQILHVWLMDEKILDTLLKAWSSLDSGLKTNTVLIITLAKNSKEIFFNQKCKKFKKFY